MWEIPSRTALYIIRVPLLLAVVVTFHADFGAAVEFRLTWHFKLETMKYAYGFAVHLVLVTSRKVLLSRQSGFAQLSLYLVLNVYYFIPTLSPLRLTNPSMLWIWSWNNREKLCHELLFKTIIFISHLRRWGLQYKRRGWDYTLAVVISMYINI